MENSEYFKNFFERLESRNQGQDEFIQAVREVVFDLEDLLSEERYISENLLERLTEPDRIISFRVCWENDEGFPEVNRGWRVQHSNLLGPYKGGLRFHATVTESVLKFLAFEQMFKNALTGLTIGGAKGGSDFNPRGRSDREVMRFCCAFMDELYRHIGDKTDVPAGDINVGSREIGYLFGHYRRLANNFSGVLTGKDIEFGGSHVRLEATGFGLVYFVKEMLEHKGDSFEDKSVAISGSGNVALHAALKACELGVKVITLSSSKGFLHIPDGLDKAMITTLISSREDSTKKLQSLGAGEWHGDSAPWSVACDIALPCATQNELGDAHARQLIAGGCLLVAEGANMPCDEHAILAFEKAGILHAPGKASNAGGVAVSALEMSQNAGFSRREYSDLDEELKQIMKSIHQRCINAGAIDDSGFINYRKGANIAAFKRIAGALVSQGFG
ncbi:MAG: glutamate dehydrogenase (NADP+) [Candidatus Azotimanducaceae bacterium]